MCDPCRVLQGLIDQLQEDVKTVRPAVEKTRPNTTKNPDVDRLEEDVNRITKRWGNCCMQAREKNGEALNNFALFSRLKVLKGGIFLDFFGFFLFMYVVPHCFICRPSGSTVSEDAWIEQRVVATLLLIARRSNHLARSHPQFSLVYSTVQLELIHKVCCALENQARFLVCLTYQQQKREISSNSVCKIFLQNLSELL
jgi:hypothetical protein